MVTARVVLLDIEGTTTPLSFVHDVLFPFARRRLRDFLQRHAGDPEVQRFVAQLAEENQQDQQANLHPPPLSLASELDSQVAYLNWLMDRDRKSTALKWLQGRVWEEGYRSGALRSEVFADVPPALERWAKQGRRTAVFSSGSTLAQKLLLAHTNSGDLTGYIHAYFDTTTGPKQAPESYGRIAQALQLAPREILFVSDVVAELDAARLAEVRTSLSLRPGNQPQPRDQRHPTVYSFDEIE